VLSKENLNRTKQEVDTIATLLEQFIYVHTEPDGLLCRYRAVLRVVGDVNNLPPSTVTAVQDGVNLTKKHKEVIVNLCVVYSSRSEITTAIRQTVADCKLPIPIKSAPDQVELGDNFLSSPQEITSDTITKRLAIPDSPIDLLIRTGGDQRLSDFLLWQCHQETSIAFVKKYWPEFSIWQYFLTLREWQRGQESK
jgi:ditrans,polycis-polyprenyl diphosphate synthase